MSHEKPGHHPSGDDAPAARRKTERDNKNRRTPTKASRQEAKARKKPESFAKQLMQIINDKHRFRGVTGWSADGRSFAILKRDLFTSQVIPEYFGRIKFESFMKRLQRHGFETTQICTLGRQDTAIFHRYFQRDNPELCRHVVLLPRNKKKKNGATPTNTDLRQNPADRDNTTDSLPRCSSDKKELSSRPSLRRPIGVMPQRKKETGTGDDRVLESSPHESKRKCSAFCETDREAQEEHRAHTHQRSTTFERNGDAIPELEAGLKYSPLVDLSSQSAVPRAFEEQLQLLRPGNVQTDHICATGPGTGVDATRESFECERLSEPKNLASTASSGSTDQTNIRRRDEEQQCWATTVNPSIVQIDHSGGTSTVGRQESLTLTSMRFGMDAPRGDGAEGKAHALADSLPKQSDCQQQPKESENLTVLEQKAPSSRSIGESNSRRHEGQKCFSTFPDIAQFDHICAPGSVARQESLHHTKRPRTDAARVDATEGDVHFGPLPGPRQGCHEGPESLPVEQDVSTPSVTGEANISRGHEDMRHVLYPGKVQTNCVRAATSTTACKENRQLGKRSRTDAPGVYASEGSSRAGAVFCPKREPEGQAERLEVLHWLEQHSFTSFMGDTLNRRGNEAKSLSADDFPHHFKVAHENSTVFQNRSANLHFKKPPTDVQGGAEHTQGGTDFGEVSLPQKRSPKEPENFPVPEEASSSVELETRRHGHEEQDVVSIAHFPRDVHLHLKMDALRGNEGPQSWQKCPEQPVGPENIPVLRTDCSSTAQEVKSSSSLNGHHDSPRGSRLVFATSGRPENSHPTEAPQMEGRTGGMAMEAAQRVVDEEQKCSSTRKFPAICRGEDHESSTPKAYGENLQQPRTEAPTENPIRGIDLELVTSYWRQEQSAGVVNSPLLDHHPSTSPKGHEDGQQCAATIKPNNARSGDNAFPTSKARRGSLHLAQRSDTASTAVDTDQGGVDFGAVAPRRQWCEEPNTRVEGEVKNPLLEGHNLEHLLQQIGTTSFLVSHFQGLGASYSIAFILETLRQQQLQSAVAAAVVASQPQSLTNLLFQARHSEQATLSRAMEELIVATSTLQAYHTFKQQQQQQQQEEQVLAALSSGEASNPENLRHS